MIMWTAFATRSNGKDVVLIMMSLENALKGGCWAPIDSSIHQTHSFPWRSVLLIGELRQ